MMGLLFYRYETAAPRVPIWCSGATDETNDDNHFFYVVLLLVLDYLKRCRVTGVIYQKKHRKTISMKEVRFYTWQRLLLLPLHLPV